MATLYRADGTSEGLDAPEGGITLAELQRLVGGDIEVIRLGRPHPKEVLIVNENGRALRLPLNDAATRLYRGTPARHQGVIVGDAVHARIYDPGTKRERVV